LAAGAGAPPAGYLAAVDNGPQATLSDLPPHLAARRTAWAAAVGLAVAAVLAPFAAWQATVLSGWATAATILLVRVWWALMHKDASATRHHAMREDDSRFVADASLLAASVASLIAVGLTLVK